jgi:hypothetical protein
MINFKIDTPDDDNFSDDELTFLPIHLWTYTENNFNFKEIRNLFLIDLEIDFDLGLNRTILITK